MDSLECSLIRNATARGDTPLDQRLDDVAFQKGLFVFVMFCTVSFTLLFAFFRYLHPKRASFHRLRVRSLRFVIITHLGTSMATVTGSWYDSRPLEETMPCWVFFSLYFLIVPCLVFPPAIQLFVFYRSTQFSDAAKKLIDDMENKSNTGGKESVLQHSWATWLAYLAIRLKCIQPQWAKSTVTSLDDASQTETRSIQPYEVNLYARLRAVRFLKSETGANLTLMIIFIPFLITVFVSLGTNEMVRLGCWGCFPNATQDIVIIVEGVFALIFLVVAYRLCLKQKDPFGFVDETRLMVWLGGIPACICLILDTVLDDSGNFKPAYLTEIFLVVYCFFQSFFQCILAVRDFRRQKTVLHACQMTLESFQRNVLDPNGLYHEAFSNHLLSEHAHENLAFIVGIDAWEKGFYDAGDRTNKVRARKLINMYVGEGSMFPCNLADFIVRKLKTSLENVDQGTTLSLEFTMFQTAKNEIVNLLFRDALSRFLQTKAFQDLHAKIQTDNSSMSGVVVPASPST